MKVIELIKILEKYNPDSDVVVGGEAIYFAEELPGYYDGSFNRLIQDKSNQFYNIEGMEFTRSGTKVNLQTLSVEDIIWGCESVEEARKLVFKIDPSLHEQQSERVKNQIQQVMKEFEDYEKNNK